MEPRRRPLRHEILTWEDVDQLVDELVSQLQNGPAFEAMLIITRGGIIPGGLLAEALDIRNVLTAAIYFPPEPEQALLLTLPRFLQFPDNELLRDRHTLIVDDVWGSGRTSTAVRGRIEGAGGTCATCVFHFNPYRSLFTRTKPDYYGAVTDAYIVYPWELDRGTDAIRLGDPKLG